MSRKVIPTLELKDKQHYNTSKTFQFWDNKFHGKIEIYLLFYIQQLFRSYTTNLFSYPYCSIILTRVFAVVLSYPNNVLDSSFECRWSFTSMLFPAERGKYTFYLKSYFPCGTALIIFLVCKFERRGCFSSHIVGINAKQAALYFLRSFTFSFKRKI